MRLGYLGPEGTFSEAALRKYSRDAEAIPFVDVPSALDAVREGALDAAVVPMENSVEGGVNATIDTLGAGEPLVIIGEVVIPIRFVLAVHPATHPEIRRIGTHPHGFAQVRKWVHATLPEAIHVPTSSTAAAAAEIADGTADFDAAICSAISAERYGLANVAEDLADNRHAVTRFVIVARPGNLPDPTGADKTTLMVHLGHNEAGGLLEMLEQFAVRGVNLSRIESRPIGDSLGRYAFSMDAEGHVADRRMQAVLIGLHRVCPVVRFIGSYPSAEGRRPLLQAGTSDEDFAAAAAWVDSILNNQPGTTTVTPPARSGEPRVAAQGVDDGDSKSRIATAALAEFRDLGYVGAAVRRIASAAGVDPGLIAYHFGGKRNLFRATVEEVMPTEEKLAQRIGSRGGEGLLLSPIATDSALSSSRTIYAAFLALLRTALTPSHEHDTTASEAAETLVAVARAVFSAAQDPLRTQVLLHLRVGIALLRDISESSPLKDLDDSEVTMLMRARMRLVDIEHPPSDQQNTEWLGIFRREPETASEAVNDDLPARERILASGRTLFARWGFNGASLRDIATAAACDVSLVHYYYGSKAGLLDAVIRDLLTPLSEMSASIDAVKYEDGATSPLFQSLLEAPGSREAIRALTISVANPGTAEAGKSIQQWIQFLLDLGIGPGDRSDIHMGYHLAVAEFVGAAIISDILDVNEDFRAAYHQTELLLQRLLKAEPQGLSLEDLASQVDDAE